MARRFTIVKRMLEEGIKIDTISYILLGDYTGKDTIWDKLGYLCLCLDISDDKMDVLAEIAYTNSENKYI